MYNHVTTSILLPKHPRRTLGTRGVGGGRLIGGYHEYISCDTPDVMPCRVRHRTHRDGRERRPVLSSTTYLKVDGELSTVYSGWCWVGGGAPRRLHLVRGGG